MNIWEQSFEDLRRPYLEEKNDGNLANNYPPYDKVTRGDVIAGATGKDQMGGKKKCEKCEKSPCNCQQNESNCMDDAPKKSKKKTIKTEERKLGGGMRPGGGYDRGYKAMQKEVEKLDSGKETAAAKRYKEMRKEYSDWRSDLDFFIEMDCGSGPMKPKKGIKNKVTINPDLKTEENLNEKPGDGYIGNTPIPNPIRLAQDAVDAYNRKQQKTVDDVNKVTPGSASMSATYFNKGPSAASKRYLGLNSYQPEGDEISERKMTSGEMQKEKTLKKKYDPSGMKASMRQQYGPEKGKQVYFATIRKQAMEQLEIVDEEKRPFPFKKVAAQQEKARKGSVYGRDTGNKPDPQVSDKEKKETTRFSKMHQASEKAKREKQVANKASRSSTFFRDTHPASAPKMKKKNEEFAGNYEGPLYAPHPDIEEGYKEIDREKETKMYRRAGNLARTALSSKGKKKKDAMKKSSNIVSAITRQKEKERFDRIGQSPKHNEALENELDYYLGEALRPASERMKRVQTDAGRKKQEKERTRKSKLEAEADKILAGYSKKGTGLAKTKPMSEQEDKSRKGTDYRGRDYGGSEEEHASNVRFGKRMADLQGGWLEREKKKKKSN